MDRRRCTGISRKRGAVSMRIVGYTYDAAIHCPDCTIKQFGDQQFLKDGSDPPVYDSEGNEVHVLFDTDEAGDTPDHCDDCGAFIDTAWHSETVGYAVDTLWQYVQDAVLLTKQGAEIGRYKDSVSTVLDKWNENL